MPNTTTPRLGALARRGLSQIPRVRHTPHARKVEPAPIRKAPPNRIAKLPARTSTPKARKITLRSGRSFFVVDAPASPVKGTARNSLLIPPRIPSHQLDWSVSGLGAYRTYKAWPGRSFPIAAVTMNDNVPKSERQ